MKRSPAKSPRSWHEFLDQVEKNKRDLKFEEREECFYRGHTCSDYPLLPTLLRHCVHKKLTEWWQIKDLENDLFFEFQARARELHQQAISDWEILFFMRHHGVATRLLDWTETLGVAVYFAIRNSKSDRTPCLWMLNPYEMNAHKRSWDSRDLISPVYLGLGQWDYSDFLVDYDKYEFGWDWPVALYPIQRNARLHAQRSYFTIHGDDIRSLEVIAPKVLRKVEIPQKIIPDALRFLESAGINDYSLFPDLDGLTRDLHRKYGIG